MPDNAIYYEIAYAATALIYLGYGLSLVARRRRLDERAARTANAASAAPVVEPERR